MLVMSIIDEFMLDEKQMSPNDFLQISQGIEQRFPTETASFYYKKLIENVNCILVIKTKKE